MSKETKVSTAERLKEAMRDAGKRQADLIRETGIDSGAMSKYLSGKYEPKQNAINKLAIALDVSEMWLWGYDVPKERTATQKNNDAIVDIVMKLRKDKELLPAWEMFNEMRKDKELFAMCVKLKKLDAEKRQAVNSVLNAFEATEK